MKTPRHPHQRIVVDHNGIKRFEQNAIVKYLLDTHPKENMNSLALLPFSKKDRVQFAQLIGYSICGFGELPYVSDKAYEEATS